MDLSDKEKQALKIISSQETGQMFLKALMRECHYQKPTITLTQYRDLSLGLTAYYEALRSVWLDLREHIDTDMLSIIELDEVRKTPIEVIGDITHERGDPSTTDTDDTDNGKLGGSVRRRREDFERKSKQFAEDYINNLYPPNPRTDESTDSGGA
jgi:hypothetical protein